MNNSYFFILVCMGAGLVLGALFGMFQWLSLRRYLQKAYRWIIANALVWGAGIGWIFLFASLPGENTGLMFHILMGVALTGVPETIVSLIAFPKINNELILNGQPAEKSFLGRLLLEDNAGTLFREMEATFIQKPEPLLISHFNEETAGSYPFLKDLLKSNLKSYLLIPFNDTIERLIKEKFTSLQNAVEWKFKETIRNYLKLPADKRKNNVEKVSFENVYPFYGAIDIRSSSLERNRATQNDLTEHLNVLKSLLMQLHRTVELPLLEEMQYKVTEYSMVINEHLTTEDELKITGFIEDEIKVALTCLAGINPELQPPIRDYFHSIDTANGNLCQHRKKYELSIEQINDVLVGYLEKEERKLQLFYPHYFEKFTTDGLEYNIYMGQSMSPEKPFTILYQKNVYLWQLRSMAEIGRLTLALSSLLPVPLHTTQLILVYNAPVTISFKRDERKFDVDGAYNIRYEIMKKRIDKVCIKQTSERLTQPGKIAIIYSNRKDAAIFEKYIDYLVGENILEPGTEYVELEELQGITGLKAIRVSIKPDN